MMEENKVCGNCIYCEKDGDFPYCVAKELYIEVDLNQECDEIDTEGNPMFISS